MKNLSVLPFCMALALTGCGSGGQMQTAPVKGRVTLDGKPLTSGVVMANPKSGRGARALIQPDGTFVFGTYTKTDGIQVGTHAITVAPLPPGEGERGNRPKKPIPPKYRQASSSGISVTVDRSGIDDLEVKLVSG